MINLSLSTLGNVIKALVEKQNGKKSIVIPYRNSNLTRMLQNALGGNSKTYMICAVRPGAKFFDETVNTLKYADRAKQIKNKAVVNEDPQDKLIRELKAENERLKKDLANAGGLSSTEQLFYFLTNCIETIESGDDVHRRTDLTKKEIEEFIDNFTNEQFEKVTGFFDSMPKLCHTLKVTNPNTKVTSEVVLEGLENFLGQDWTMTVQNLILKLILD